MLVILLVLTVVFCLMGMWLNENKPNQLVMLGLSTFLGIGGAYLCYQEGESYYAYIPVSFAIVSLIYSIYVIWDMIMPRDWEEQDDQHIR